jgi:MoxR-like ATPase
MEDVNRELDMLHRAAQSIKDALYDKDEIIDMMFICAIAQEPMLVLGPPGVAKTQMVKLWCQALNIQPAMSTTGDPFLFEYLLTPFTEPDELFGGVDLAALKEGKFSRLNTMQMLPGATVVFLDEVFRANSAILNSLLTLINERRFFENGAPRDAKVKVIFGAANKPPTEEHLAAFYARFPIRMYSRQTNFKDEKAAETLLMRGFKLEMKRHNGSSSPTNSPIPPAKLMDLDKVQNDFAARWGNLTKVQHGETLANLVGAKFHEAFVEMIKQLRLQESWRPLALDDRKVIKLLKIALARAYWRSERPDGAEKWPFPETRDLLVLQYISDDSEADQQPLQGMVCKMIFGKTDSDLLDQWNNKNIKQTFPRDAEDILFFSRK